MQNKKNSPIRYLKEKGRSLAIDKCYLSDAYEDGGVTIALIVRKQPNGKFSFASFMVDRMCLGVKDAASNCNMEESDIEHFLERVRQNAPTEEITAELLHNIVYAAIDYADELGFSQHKDFNSAKFLLDESLITDGIDEIECGLKGRPTYIEGPYDNVRHILRTLTRTVGEDGFDYVSKEDRFET